MTEVIYIQSKDNPQLKKLRRLVQDALAYRKEQQCWVEGEHLCRAALDRGWTPKWAVFSESFWQSQAQPWATYALKNTVAPDAVFKSVSALESLHSFGFVFDLPDAQPIAPHVATLVLDRVQDAGNVGSMLRSAAAFGFRQVLALKGTAGLWSSKVLRAGMGAHFGLQLFEGVSLQAVQGLQMPIITTSSHQGQSLHELQLPFPCAWVMGHEGQGVAFELASLSTLQAQIAQPGGQESLNVAAAAAICLHASAISPEALAYVQSVSTV